MKKFFPGTVILPIVACLLWSTAFAGIKLGLPYTTPLHFAGVRFLLSGLMILPFAGSYRTYGIVFRQNLKLVLLVSFLHIFFQYSMQYLGLSRVPAALGAIIIGSCPLFVAMVAHFNMPGDRLTMTKLSIFLVGIAGIVLVTIGRNEFAAFEEVGLLGIGLLLLVNIAIGITNVIVARDSGFIPPLVLSSASMLLGGLALFLVSLPIEGMTHDPKPPVYYGSLLWLSFVSAAAISIWFALLKLPEVKVSDLNFWKFIMPIAGAVIAWLIIPGEEPSLVAISGMVVIALALVLLNIHKTRSVT
jgi:drug/metabolite transporter (DMT)-like permease